MGSWLEIVVIVALMVVCVVLLVSGLVFVAQVQYLILYRTDDGMKEGVFRH